MGRIVQCQPERWSWKDNDSGKSFGSISCKRKKDCTTFSGPEGIPQWLRIKQWIRQLAGTITGEEKIQNCIVKDLFDNLSLLPANRNLAGAEIELMTVDKMQFIMKHNLEKVKKQYDFIIIDCPTALGMLTVKYTWQQKYDDRFQSM